MSTDTAFLALTLALCTKKKKTRRWIREWLNLRDKYTHENLLCEKQDTVMRQSIPPSQRLSITLRYLATGADFEDLKFLSCISPRALSEIIIETCEAINETLSDNIKVPRTQGDWKRLAQQFGNRWNFDHCIGAVDGEHVTIQKPENSGSYYYNYKGTYSIVLMGIANANYEFIILDTGLKNTKF